LISFSLEETSDDIDVGSGVPVHDNRAWKNEMWLTEATLVSKEEEDCEAIMFYSLRSD
jgi:hypothetical protein